MIFFPFGVLLEGFAGVLVFPEQYLEIEKKLNNGVIGISLSDDVSFFIAILMIAILVTCIFLLYNFKNIGRYIYLIIISISIIYQTFDGDMVRLALTYPIEYFMNFFEIFILYIIFISPLKDEFK